MALVRALRWRSQVREQMSLSRMNARLNKRLRLFAKFRSPEGMRLPYKRTVLIQHR